MWCSGLNTFYGGEYRFQAARPDLWTIDLPQKPQWTAEGILDVCGQLDGSQTAHGKTQQWLTLGAELQMWLHNHPHNEERKTQALPPINGVWLWRVSETENAGKPDFQAALFFCV